MTVETDTSKSGPYAGAGTTGPFTVGFRFLADDHLSVVQADADGVETVLTLTTDYTVTGAGGASGTVTLVSALPVGETLTITRDVPFTQEADYVQNDAFPAESHETALDLLTMQTQQLKEQVDRAAKLPVSSTDDADALVADIVFLADNFATLEAVVANEDNINTVAAEIGVSGDVTIVAADLAGANTIGAVAGIAADVSAVAGIAADVTTVATFDAADIETIADNIADVTNFSDVYLGPAAADPTTRNDSSPLQAGDLYFNTGDDVMRVYNGATWQDVAQGTSFPYQTLSGTGAQTAFTLSSAPGSLGSLEVYISGVRQTPTTDYTLSGTTLTFVAAPPLGTGNIFARWVTVQALSVPSDGSVTAAKLDAALVNSLTTVTLDAAADFVMIADASDSSANKKALLPSATDALKGVVELATDAEVQTGTDTARAVTPAGMKAGLNASGSAPTYAARAWVNFNGSGTVAIRASGNVTSITDHGTGDYSVNFTTALPDANYAPVAVINGGSSAGTVTAAYGTTAPTTTAYRFGSRRTDTSVAIDSEYCSIAFFR